MKVTFKGLMIAVLAILVNGQFAPKAHAVDLGFELGMYHLQETLGRADGLNLIDWKVGDEMRYDVNFGGLPFGGKMLKVVTKDEGDALWMRQDIDLMIQKQVVDVLISKADGKILKIIRDGKEQEIPNDQIEIISQDYGEVSVPAGTFKAIHIVAKTQQVEKLEVWINPKDTVMDGTLKQIINANGTTITMSLKSFKHGN